MASQLSVTQKKQLVEYKVDFQKDEGKLPYKDQLAYCQQNFKQSPSESAISQIWQDRKKWLHHKSDANPRGKRIRYAKWVPKPIFEPVLPAEPPIPLFQAREAAVILSRFMAGNAE